MGATISMSALPQKLEAAHAAALRSVHRGLRAGAHASRAHLVRVTPKDRGMAQVAWKVHNGPLNSRPPTPAAWLENSAPYIGVLEKGARPHPVSLEGQRAIYEWVERSFYIIGNKSTQLVVSGRLYGPRGKGSASLTNTKSALHKRARAGYLDKLSKLGAMLEDNLVRNFPDMGRRMVPAALNIAAAIINKIRKKGSKPHYFVRDSLDLMARMAQGEVERELRALGQKPPTGATS